MADVIVHRDGTSEIILFDRASRHNSIGGEFLGDLIEAAERADADPQVRSIVTTGDGSCFCVGLDVASLGDPGSRLDLAETGTDGAAGRTGLPVLPIEQRRVDHLGIGRWVTRFMELGTPTIAAINGAAAGGGLGLAMVHDFRIMSSEAKLVAGFGALGLGAEFGLSYILPRLIGSSRALRTMTRKAPIGAEEALALGLVDDVVEPHDVVREALAFGAQFAEAEDRSVRSMKRLLRQSWDSTLLEQLEREWLAQRFLFDDPRTSATVDELRRRLGQLAPATAGPTR